MSTLLCGACTLPYYEDDADGLCPRCTYKGVVDQFNVSTPPAADVLTDPGLGAIVPPNTVDYQERIVICQQRYRLLHVHTEGGMGTVWIARDDGLCRRVAFKEVKPGLAADGRLHDRLLVEGEITARLQHPGIAPVHALGNDDPHGPFYVMKLVEGQDLHEAIRDFHRPRAAAPASRGTRRPVPPSPWTVRKLLARFIDVCQAVEYAHRCGVVNRDIKPGNVRLGKFGETVVLDWGLARPFDLKRHPLPETTDDVVSGLKLIDVNVDDLYDTGKFLGTPGYTSPEQACGDVPGTGPRSDVFSLGAMLYEILTGRPPLAPRKEDFDGAGRLMESYWQRVAKAEFVPAREANQAAHAALSAICGKALKCSPADRYASARALAEDVERFLADDPVLAYPEPLLARTRRRLRKHRTLVSTAAGILIVAVPLLLIGLLMLSSANAAERAARGEADKKRKEAEEQREEVRKLLVEVDQRRRQAEGSDARAKQVLLAFNAASSKLQAVPGAEKIREQIDAIVIQHFRRFADENPDEPQWRSDLAAAYARAGELMLRRDKSDSAASAFEKAITLYEQLLSESPDELEYLIVMARTLNSYAVLQSATEGEAAALTSYLRSREFHEKMVRLEPSFDRKRGLAIAKLNLGKCRAFTGSWHEGLGLVREAHADLKMLTGGPEVLKDRPRAILEYVEACANLMGLLNGKEADAPSHQEEIALLRQDAMRALNELTRFYPGEPDYRAQLAKFHVVEGVNALRQDRLDEATQCLADAMTLLDPIVLQYPEVPAYWAYAADVYYFQAEIAHKRGEGQLAKSKLNAAWQVMQQRVVGPHPEFGDYRKQASQIESALAKLDDEVDLPAEALRRAIEARNAVKRLVEEEPRELQHKVNLITLQAELVKIHEELNQLGDAEREAAEAVRMADEVSQGGPGPFPAITRTMLAGIQVKLDKLPEARETLETALKIQTQVPRVEGDEFNFATSQAMLLFLLGIVARANEAPEEAIRRYDETMSLLRPLKERTPEIDPRDLLNQAAIAKAEVVRSMDQPSQAAETIREALPNATGSPQLLHALAVEFARCAKALPNDDALKVELLDTLASAVSAAEADAEATVDNKVKLLKHMATLHEDEVFDVVRDEPRFQELLKRLKEAK